MSEIQEEVKIQCKNEPKQDICVRCVDCEKCKHRMRNNTIAFIVISAIGGLFIFAVVLCAAITGV